MSKAKKSKGASKVAANDAVVMEEIASLVGKDLYDVLFAPTTRPCCRSDHMKIINCQSNPWCVYGLGEHKEGLWGTDYLKIMQSLQRNFVDNNSSCSNTEFEGSTNSSSSSSSIVNINKHQVAKALKSLQFLINNHGIEHRIRKPMAQSTQNTDSKSAEDVNESPGLGADLEFQLRAIASPIGLKNLGATCYLNVLIQCLYHNPCIRQAIYRIPGTGSADTNSGSIGTVDAHTAQMRRIVSSLQSVFAHMEGHAARSYDLQEFVGLLGLDTGAQQDPQEFNRLFIEQLERLQQQAPSTVTGERKGASAVTITSLISGMECYTTTCKACGSRSKRESLFHELDLNISDLGGIMGDGDGDGSAPSLAEIIQRNYCGMEHLTGDNRYECTACCARLNNPAARQEATRQGSISRFPDVLFLQMLRYVYDAETGTKKKLSNEVEYPSVLELKQSPTAAMEEYCLTAVLYHTGRSAYSGHYITEVLDWPSGRWWLCDDSVVVEVTDPVETVERQRRIKEEERQRKAKNRSKNGKTGTGGKKSSKKAETVGYEEVVVLGDDEEEGEEGAVAVAVSVSASTATAPAVAAVAEPMVVDLDGDTDAEAEATAKSSGRAGAGRVVVSAAATAAMAANVNRLSDVYMLCYVRKSVMDAFRTNAACASTDDIASVSLIPKTENKSKAPAGAFSAPVAAPDAGGGTGVSSMCTPIPAAVALAVRQSNLSLRRTARRYCRLFADFKQQLEARQTQYLSIKSDLTPPVIVDNDADAAAASAMMVDLDAEKAIGSASVSEIASKSKNTKGAGSGLTSGTPGTSVVRLKDPHCCVVPTAWLRSWITGVDTYTHTIFAANATTSNGAGTGTVDLLDVPSPGSSSKGIAKSGSSGDVVELDCDHDSPYVQKATKAVSVANAASVHDTEEAVNEEEEEEEEEEESSTSFPFLFNQPYLSDATHLCPHRQGLDPRTLGSQFKIVSARAFAVICSSLVSHPMTEWVISANELASGGNALEDVSVSAAVASNTMVCAVDDNDGDDKDCVFVVGMGSTRTSSCSSLVTPTGIATATGTGTGAGTGIGPNSGNSDMSTPRSQQHQNIRCGTCMAELHSEQFSNLDELRRLKGLIDRLQEEEEQAFPTYVEKTNTIVDRSITHDTGSSDDMGAGGGSAGSCGRYFYVSRMFLKDLNKYYKDSVTVLQMGVGSGGSGGSALQTPQKKQKVGGIEQFCSSSSARTKGGAVGTSSTSSNVQSKIVASMKAFSEITDINGNVTCTHGLLVTNFKSRVKLVSENLWQALVTHHEGWAHSTSHECTYQILTSSSTATAGTISSAFGGATGSLMPTLTGGSSAATNSSSKKGKGRDKDKVDVDIVIRVNERYHGEDSEVGARPRCCLFCAEDEAQEEQEQVETEVFQEMQLRTVSASGVPNCLAELYRRPETSKYCNNAHISPRHARMPPSLIALLECHGQSHSSTVATVSTSNNNSLQPAFYLVDFNWLTVWRSYLSDADKTVPKRSSVLHDHPGQLSNAAVAPLLYCSCSDHCMKIDTEAGTVKKSQQSQSQQSSSSKVVIPPWVANLSEFYDQLYDTKRTEGTDRDDTGGRSHEDANEDMQVDEEVGGSAAATRTSAGAGAAGVRLYPEVEIVTAEQWRRLRELYPVDKITDGTAANANANTNANAAACSNDSTIAIVLDESDNEGDIEILSASACMPASASVAVSASPAVCEVGFVVPVNLPEPRRWIWQPDICARCTKARKVELERQRVHFSCASFRVVLLASHSAAMQCMTDAEYVRSLRTNTATDAVAATAAVSTSSIQSSGTIPASSVDAPAGARSENSSLTFVPLSSTGRQRKPPSQFVPGSNTQPGRRSQRTTKKKEVQVRLSCTDTVLSAKMKVYEALADDTVVNPMRQLLLFSPDGTEWTGSQKTLLQCGVVVDEEAESGASIVYVRVITRSNIEHYMRKPSVSGTTIGAAGVITAGAGANIAAGKRGRKRKKEELPELSDDSDFESTTLVSDVSSSSAVVASHASRGSPVSFPKDVLDAYFAEFCSNYDEFTAGDESSRNGGVEVGFSGTFLSSRTTNIPETNDDTIQVQQQQQQQQLHKQDDSSDVILIGEESNQSVLISLVNQQCQEDKDTMAAIAASLISAQPTSASANTYNGAVAVAVTDIVADINGYFSNATDDGVGRGDGANDLAGNNAAAVESAAVGTVIDRGDAFMAEQGTSNDFNQQQEQVQEEVEEVKVSTNSNITPSRSRRARTTAARPSKLDVNLARLIEFGCDAELAELALKACGNDFNRALNQLTSTK